MISFTMDADVVRRIKMNNNCRECGKPDTGLLNPYKPPPGKTFLCSACVMEILHEKEDKKK